METAGYSGKPLTQKLGIKPGTLIVAIGSPRPYAELASPIPSGVEVVEELSSDRPFIHYFTTLAESLTDDFPRLKAALRKDGVLWISWPKGASRLKTDLSENRVRDIGLANGLVDVKVCAVDADWSALKFVYRTKDR